VRSSCAIGSRVLDEEGAPTETSADAPVSLPFDVGYGFTSTACDSFFTSESRYWSSRPVCYGDAAAPPAGAVTVRLTLACGAIPAAGRSVAAKRGFEGVKTMPSMASVRFPVK
jgi:hypothetical protein